MNEFQQWHADTLQQKVITALQKNHFNAQYAPTCQAAVAAALALIPADATIGIGGSQTLVELDLPNLLEQRGHTLYNHNKPGLTPDESLALRRQQLTSDVFLTSSNAITLDGQIVNVDGAGNRVAAMIFGPQKVIILAGINKLASDLHEAESRIKLYAAPINNKRLSRPNPCVTTGQCMNCQGPSRICNVTTILHKKPFAVDMHVILVGEPLGF